MFHTRKERISVEQDKKTAAVLGFQKASKKAAGAGFKPRYNHVKQMKFYSTGFYSVIITKASTTAK